MSHPFQWNGAWRKVEREERAGIVTGIRLGVSGGHEPQVPAPSKPRASAVLGSAVLEGDLRAGARVDMKKMEPKPASGQQVNGRFRMCREG